MKAAKANERPKTLSTVATRKRRTMLSRLRDIVFISEKLYLNCLDPFSFSFLDERKGDKRKSRHQGCLPSCPGTSNATKRVTPSCGRQSCTRKKYPENFPALGRGPFLDARKGGKRKSRHQGCLPSWPGISNATKRLVPSCMYPAKLRRRPKPP